MELDQRLPVEENQLSMSQEELAEGDKAPASGAGRASARPRLAYIVYFRATAIALIVAGHSYELASINLSSHLDFAISDMVKGATALFVFISGFLFDYVYRDTFAYATFLADKAKRLLIPYLSLTALAELMFWSLPEGEGIGHKLYRDLILGDTFQAYWYIPFIVLMFALAPVHRRFMTLRAPHQIAIILAMTVLAGFVQRPLGNDNAFQSVLFYMPIYLSGLFLSLNRETILPLLTNNLAVLLPATLSLTMIQSLSGQSGNLHKSLLSINGFELMGIQKTSFSFALISLFSHLPNQPNRIVNIVAETSFAIFFLHPFVLRLIEGTSLFRISKIQWLDLAIATAAVVAICVMIAVGVRGILKDKSKHVVGY